MHLKRLITAAVFLPLVFAYVMYLPPQYYLYLLLVVSTVALYEFYEMSGITGLLRYTGLALGVVLLVIFFRGRVLRPDALLAAVMLVGGVRLFSKRDTTGSIMDVAYTLLGLFYIPGLLSYQLDLVVQAGPRFIILMYGSVWAADSAAYYVGKGIGKMKLYPEVSPNKTVEGAIASVIGGGLGAVILRFALVGSVSLLNAIMLGTAVGMMTIVGDLAESMFKRDAGVKDSGGLIPGHGGVLDKIDGVLYAGPFFLWFCRYFGIIS